jgi:hypothetical protein
MKQSCGVYGGYRTKNYNMANQDKVLSPQQEKFLFNYTNPKSPFFSNAKQSALDAGYKETYADNITDAMPDWLLENIGDMKRLRKAEKNLDEVQNIEIYNKEGLPDPQLIDKRTKVDMFLAERLDKSKYSTRNELTGKDGKEFEIKTIIINKA